MICHDDENMRNYFFRFYRSKKACDSGHLEIACMVVRVSVCLLTENCYFSEKFKLKCLITIVQQFTALRRN